MNKQSWSFERKQKPTLIVISLCPFLHTLLANFFLALFGSFGLLSAIMGSYGLLSAHFELHWAFLLVVVPINFWKMALSTKTVSFWLEIYINKNILVLKFLIHCFFQSYEFDFEMQRNCHLFNIFHFPTLLWLERKAWISF
jgi:hypothetical protein